MKKNLLWIAAILCFSFSGCVVIGGYADMARNISLSEEYHAVLAKWTRGKTLYSQFETKIRLVATCVTGEFMEAYIAENTRLYNETDRAAVERMEGFIRDDTGVLEIVFYASSPKEEVNDFASTPSSWVVFLQTTDGERLDPVEIREIKDITPQVEAFFPYVQKRYGKFYSLLFQRPQPTDTCEGILVFTGVVGRIELSW
ncbi:MAG: hypothetical protein JXO48_06090 [Deltaproteobacteria bacterium]|nr:hypothetical protein [Deltaproteobacteria bacterium]